MATASIEEFIVGLQLAENSRLKVLERISDVLYNLACFLAKIDRRHVRNITVKGFIASLPVDLSPSTLYNWRFSKIGTVRDTRGTGALSIILVLS